MAKVWYIRPQGFDICPPPPSLSIRLCGPCGRKEKETLEPMGNRLEQVRGTQSPYHVNYPVSLSLFVPQIDLSSSIITLSHQLPSFFLMPLKLFESVF